jgi:hypothetical protein
MTLLGAALAYAARWPNPANRLLEELRYGFADPGPELYAAAERTASWFEDEPEQRAVYMPRFREAGRYPLTRQLWAAVEPILCPDVPGRQDAPAPSRQAAPTRAPISKPAPQSPAIAPQVDRAAIAVLVSRVLEWHRTLPDTALAEAASLAPGLVGQAQELMDKAERAPTLAAARAILKEWARTWAGLAGVQEPAL